MMVRHEEEEERDKKKKKREREKNKRKMGFSKRLKDHKYLSLQAGLKEENTKAVFDLMHTPIMSKVQSLKYSNNKHISNARLHTIVEGY